MIFFFLLIPFFSFSSESFKTLPDDYLDQVMQRKKPLLQECASKLNTPAQDLLIEISIEPSGKTTSRLIRSKQKNKNIIRCSLGILDRTRFKKFSNSRIVKTYYFQF